MHLYQMIENLNKVARNSSLFIHTKYIKYIAHTIVVILQFFIFRIETILNYTFVVQYSQGKKILYLFGFVIIKYYSKGNSIKSLPTLIITRGIM